MLAVDAFDRAPQKKLATGKLLTLDNQIDTTTGTVKVRALFDNKDAALFPNQFVNTRLLVNTLRGVTLFPASAIQQNGQASFVYVIQDNVAHIRSVKAGITDAGLTQVEGVQPGDMVANSSFEKLQDKSPVVIVEQACRGRRWRRAPPSESIPPVHSPAGRHLAADGRHPPGRPGWLHAVAGLGAAGSGLPDHPGAHVLSRRQPRR